MLVKRTLIVLTLSAAATPAAFAQWPQKGLPPGSRMSPGAVGQMSSGEMPAAPATVASDNSSLAGSWLTTIDFTPCGCAPPFKLLATFTRSGGYVSAAQGDVVLNAGIVFSAQQAPGSAPATARSPSASRSWPTTATGCSC